jgi:hypothetical protein
MESDEITNIYLGGHRQPWQNQSNEEEQTRASQEPTWPHQYSLHAAWEAQMGTRRNTHHHCLRTPSWPTLEKDQVPFFFFLAVSRKPNTK